MRSSATTSSAFLASAARAASSATERASTPVLESDAELRSPATGIWISSVFRASPSSGSSVVSIESLMKSLQFEAGSFRPSIIAYVL